MAAKSAQLSRIEWLTRVATLACEVAMEAPAKQNKFSRAAYIPWDLVTRIRAELEAGGVEWRAKAAAKPAATSREG